MADTTQAQKDADQAHERAEDARQAEVKTQELLAKQKQEEANEAKKLADATKNAK